MTDDNEPDETEGAPPELDDDIHAPIEDDTSVGPQIDADPPAPGGGLTDAMPSSESKSSGPAFMGVPIEVTISVGKARPLVSDLVKLRRDSVISLDTKIDDPVEIYIGDKLIARGELQEMEDSDGQLGVRLTEVADIASSV